MATYFITQMELSNGDQGKLLPPKPEEPLDSDCCGTGCSPCVFDLFKTKLQRWESECEKIRTGGNLSLPENIHKNEEFDYITPYEYVQFVVKNITQECHSCKIVHFNKACETSQMLPHFNYNSFPVKLGQHVVLRLKDKSRQYTVLDIKSDGSLNILFKIYQTGLLTPLIDNLVIGDKVQMRGPFGKEFHYEANSYDNIIVLAAGTGIAPFCRIFDKILHNDKDDTRVLLLFSCRNENEILLLNKCKEWARSWNFEVQYYLSKVEDEKFAVGIHYGMNVYCKKLDKTDIELLINLRKSKNNVYLICGTKSFEKDILKYLQSFDVEEEKIKLF
ncbi:unnamed protein product [Orchesella dallaii]|uniref:FAD-binding FR-type domain-containing protein n=1 Tax=Orchesella dallaii TaxID=48710 RepID=A0ABP1QSJ1_9HEXA